jgi:hypothetical protein
MHFIRGSAECMKLKRDVLGCGGFVVKDDVIEGLNNESASLFGGVEFRSRCASLLLVSERHKHVQPHVDLHLTFTPMN